MSDHFWTFRLMVWIIFCNWCISYISLAWEISKVSVTWQLNLLTKKFMNYHKIMMRLMMMNCFLGWSTQKRSLVLFPATYFRRRSFDEIKKFVKCLHFASINFCKWAKKVFFCEHKLSWIFFLLWENTKLRKKKE